GVVRELARETYSAAAGHSDAAGPVQLNIAFTEPLSGVVGLTAGRGAAPQRGSLETRPPANVCLETIAVDGDASTSGSGATSTSGKAHKLSAAPHTVVVAGHAAGERAEETARALGAPLLAEVSSGARFGPNLVAAYRELLRDADFGGLIERAIVFGHPTLSREVPQLIQRADVHTIVVRGGSPEDYNPGRRVAEFVDAIEVEGAPDPDRSWLGRWVHTSRGLIEASDDAPVVDAPDAYDGTVTA